MDSNEAEVAGALCAIGLTGSFKALRNPLPSHCGVTQVVESALAVCVDMVRCDDEASGTLPAVGAYIRPAIVA
jgi:hypothetical protein